MCLFNHFKIKEYKINYISFENQQNKYDQGDNLAFFPETLNTPNCFSRHLLVNKYLITRSPKYLFWALEFDPNVLMDPYFVKQLIIGPLCLILIIVMIKTLSKIF